MKKNLKYFIVGAVLIIIVLGLFLVIKDTEKVEIVADTPELQGIAENLNVNFEWREFTTSTPTGGRFRYSCEEGNRAQIYMDLSLDIEDQETYFTCKVDITAHGKVEGERDYTDAWQLNLGSERAKAEFIAFANEPAKDHSIDVCCSSGDKTQRFCKTYEFKAYC